LAIKICCRLKMFVSSLETFRAVFRHAKGWLNIRYF